MNRSTNTRYDSIEALKSLKSIRSLAYEVSSTMRSKVVTSDIEQRTWFNPLVWIKVGDLFTDLEYQRLMNKSFIGSANRFDPELFRPIYAFKRPDGKTTISDGQHTAVLSLIYTTHGPDFEIPIQLIEHPLHYTLEDCVAVESRLFSGLNVNRRNVDSLGKFRAALASKDDDAIEIRANMVRFGVHIQGIGDDNGHSVNGFTKLCAAMNMHSDHPEHLDDAIQKYADLQENPAAKKWKMNDDMKAPLIFGLSMIYKLLFNLKVGDKYDSLSEYVDMYLLKTDPKDIIRNTAGNLQHVLIARRIIDMANVLIDAGVIKNNRGHDTIKIGEKKLFHVGLGDPSRSSSPAGED